MFGRSASGFGRCESVITHFTAAAGRRDAHPRRGVPHLSTYYNEKGDFGITMYSSSRMKYEVDSELTFEAWESGKWTVLLQGWGSQSTGSVDLTLTAN